MCRQLLDRAAARAVAVTEDDVMLQQLTGCNQLLEVVLFNKMVIDPVPLPRPLRASGGGDRQGEVRVLLQQGPGNRRLAGTRGRREDQHEPAALNFHWRFSLHLAHPITRDSVPVPGTARSLP